jgi:hypothetical protein
MQNGRQEKKETETLLTIIPGRTTQIMNYGRTTV